MARKPLIQTDSFPYHITARSNNRESFYLPKHDCWHIFVELLKEATIRFHLLIHAFVMMDNHYHMLCTVHSKYPISKVMEWFQRSANRLINDKANRINHLFGGPYKGSLICNEIYYYHALRYIYQNPMAVGIVKKCEDYRFSTILYNELKIPLTSPCTGIESLVPKNENEFLEYINHQVEEKCAKIIHQSLRKNTFEFPSRLPQKIKKELNLRY